VDTLRAGSVSIGSLTGILQSISGVVSASSTLSVGFGGTGLTSYVAGDILYADSSGALARLPAGGAGQVLKITAGLPAWGADNMGSGGGAGAWSTTTDDLAVYPADSSDVVIIGNSVTTTPSSILEVIGGSYFSGFVGIGSTTPSSRLSVAGNAYVSGSLVTSAINATQDQRERFYHSGYFGNRLPRLGCRLDRSVWATAVRVHSDTCDVYGRYRYLHHSSREYHYVQCTNGIVSEPGSVVCF
jgi:hypothetical protein